MDTVNTAIAYDSPIDPAEWGIHAANTHEGQRAKLVVFLPEGADALLTDKLDNCLDAQGKEVSGDRRDYYVTTQTVRRNKMEMAARIVRGWALKIGWAQVESEVCA